ncbi:polyadenylate-binding protein, cytoplasmic and nuclear, putative [Entamoeba invadens IP1]|uniref:Polyadenylate-binding protein, cytoplasmic and nuclear, putative n=2 Tax=Entamoeba invadens TaxID=33085 RepID=A0A0A1UCP9_ENTIV|nr:polyadenylate-binding protein, cytoplasmic and nuclear, putative [Entamoeba invadens IP1]ELP90069.1 polyadenylate-binding protein, cytoplasmic and nuclear, putative [Entamoeba invadens IP1]BAN41257.1 polyadenylate-binding protein, cytoplasmic and nuclear, putative [Entamoeba invadens]|eukprot:XP_004256840.1 polyadenylate-binding protein, cytoplasmic and nuclear, putative [Entamoeba invadens IP1]
MSKLYVCNLSYSTKESDLEKFFASFGNIKSCKLMISRGYSKGFGFVEYETEDDAKKALAANETEFMGRKLRIDIARPPRERHESAQQGSQEGDNERRDERSGAPRRYGGYRNYENRYNRNYERSYERPYQRNDGEVREYRSYQRRPYNPNYERRYERRNYDNEYERRPYEGHYQRKPYYTRPYKKEEENVEVSDTFVFVKNLPYSVDDAQLAEVFAKYSVKKAVIAHFNKGTKVLSKGFGFVELESKEKQQLAITEMNNFVIENRNITVVAAFKRQEEQTVKN